MKLMQIYEKAWIVAAVAAIGVGSYNFISAGTFDETVYFPITIGIFCIVLFFTKRNHRLFMENLRKQKEEQSRA